MSSTAKVGGGYDGPQNFVISLGWEKLLGLSTLLKYKVTIAAGSTGHATKDCF